jgi:hypothetical protein
MLCSSVSVKMRRRSRIVQFVAWAHEDSMQVSNRQVLNMSLTKKNTRRAKMKSAGKNDNVVG